MIGLLFFGSHLLPFIKAIRRNQTSAAAHCFTKQRLGRSGFSHCINSFDSDCGALSPPGNEPPPCTSEHPSRLNRTLSNGGNRISRRNIVTRIPIYFAHHVKVIPDLLGCSAETVTATHNSLDKQVDKPVATIAFGNHTRRLVPRQFFHDSIEILRLR